MDSLQRKILRLRNDDFFDFAAKKFLRRRNVRRRFARNRPREYDRFATLTVRVLNEGLSLA
jgi:hypothetical protein